MRPLTNILCFWKFITRSALAKSLRTSSQLLHFETLATRYQAATALRHAGDFNTLLLRRKRIKQFARGDVVAESGETEVVDGFFAALFG